MLLPYVQLYRRRAGLERSYAASRDWLHGSRVRRPWQQACKVERTTRVPAGLVETAAMIP